MLSAETYYGNVEYKRIIITNCQDRIYQLATQMLFRLNEGEGCCYYYLGVEDDGKISNVSKEELDISLDNLKKIVLSINCKIDKIFENDKYIKVKINKNVMDIDFVEIKVLLIGDTNTGKTTFLAFLIKNLLCKNANLFLLSHKHELETGKNSSVIINYDYYDKYRFVFFDTPGDVKYKKTVKKLLNKINFDIVLNFNISNKFKVNIKDGIFENIIIDNNLFSNKILEKCKIYEYLINLYNSTSIIYPYQLCQENVKFIIIKKFYNPDIGSILFGYLENGTIYKNQKLLYKYHYKNENISITILSIFIDNKEYEIVNNNCCFTIRINKIINSTKGIIINQSLQ
jgi:GTPase SAR1 family protein